MNTTLNILNIKFLYDNVLTKNIELRSIRGNRLYVLEKLSLCFVFGRGGLTPKRQ